MFNEFLIIDISSITNYATETVNGFSLVGRSHFDKAVILGQYFPKALPLFHGLFHNSLSYTTTTAQSFLLDLDNI